MIYNICCDIWNWETEKSVKTTQDKSQESAVVLVDFMKNVVKSTKPKVVNSTTLLVISTTKVVNSTTSFFGEKWS